jgi:hypothetical protein
MNRRELLQFIPVGLLGSLGDFENMQDKNKNSIQLAAEKAFIKHNDVWFLAIGDTIKWCPIEYEAICHGKVVKVKDGYLPNKKWPVLTLPNDGDRFDFWQEKKDDLLWVGKYTTWQIVYSEGLLSFQLHSHNSVKSRGKTPSG